MSKEYSDIRDVPTEVIDNCILRFKERFCSECTLKYGNDFGWIESVINLTAPSFHLFCFRIGQCVFSCRVAIIDDDIRYENGTWQFKIVNYDNYCGDNERLKICKDNNLIPCVIVLDIKEKQSPTFALDEGYALTQFDIDDYVLQNNNSKMSLSKYEIRIMSLSIILDYLSKNSIVLQAISSMPEMMPAIYCTDSENNIAIIDRISVNKQSTETAINRDSIKLLSQDYQVQLFDINIVSEDFIKGNSKQIYRGDELTISLDSIYKYEDSMFASSDETDNDRTENYKVAQKNTRKNWIKKLAQLFNIGN